MVGAECAKKNRSQPMHFGAPPPVLTFFNHSFCLAQSLDRFKGATCAVQNLGFKGVQIRQI
jgi:hypothetical protein